MVIFGATGDLTMRKLVPALYNLALEGLLPTGFTLVGVARRPMTDERVPRRRCSTAVNKYSRTRPVQPQVWETFAQGIFYVPGEFDDAAGFAALRQRLDAARRRARHRAATRCSTWRPRPTSTRSSPQPGRGRPGPPRVDPRPGQRGGLEPHRRREAVRPRPAQRPAS